MLTVLTSFYKQLRQSSGAEVTRASPSRRCSQSDRGSSRCPASGKPGGSQLTPARKEALGALWRTVPAQGSSVVTWHQAAGLHLTCESGVQVGASVGGRRLSRLPAALSPTPACSPRGAGVEASHVINHICRVPSLANQRWREPFLPTSEHTQERSDPLPRSTPDTATCCSSLTATAAFSPACPLSPAGAGHRAASASG